MFNRHHAAVAGPNLGTWEALWPHEIDHNRCSVVVFACEDLWFFRSRQLPRGCACLPSGHARS